jgi:hypothetical protein
VQAAQNDRYRQTHQRGARDERLSHR